MDRVGTAKVSPLQTQRDRIAVEVRPADGETETLQRSKRWKFCIKRVIANVTKKWRPRVGNSLISAKHRNASVLQASEGIPPKAQREASVSSYNGVHFLSKVVFESCFLRK